MSQEIEEKDIAQELEKMQLDPWLPIESKLVWGCIGLGIILLIILVFISYTFFPASHS